MERDGCRSPFSLWVYNSNILFGNTCRAFGFCCFCRLLYLSYRITFDPFLGLIFLHILYGATSRFVRFSRSSVSSGPLFVHPIPASSLSRLPWDPMSPRIDSRLQHACHNIGCTKLHYLVFSFIWLVLALGVNGSLYFSATAASHLIFAYLLYHIYYFRTLWIKIVIFTHVSLPLFMFACISSILYASLIIYGEQIGNMNFVK